VTTHVVALAKVGAMRAHLSFGTALLVGSLACGPRSPADAAKSVAATPTTGATHPAAATARPPVVRTRPAGAEDLPRVALGAHGAVASQERLATEVGIAILRKGGNAIDAAIAVGFALAATHPPAGNIGGGGFMLVRLATGSAVALDFRETAPSAASRDMFLDAKGNPTNESIDGPRGAGIPGTVSGFAVAHRRFGTLPWRDVVMPAVALARAHEVDAFEAKNLERGREAILKAGFPASRRSYEKADGSAFAAGDRWSQPELAETLSAVADDPSAFYRGPLAAKLVRGVREAGGIWTEADLAGYATIEREPMRFAYRGHELVTMPLPSAGGIVMRQILHGCEVLDLARLPWHSVDEVHAYAEVARRARQIALVGGRHFAPLALRSAVTRRIAPDAWARPLRRTFEDLGATFMKFGQLIGSAPGVFGDSVADEFRSCLDTGTSVPFDEVRRIVERDLGMPLDEAFWSFSESPIGRASISVVHKATTRDGRRVAVKVLRPGIEHRVATDLDLFQPLLELVAKQTGEYAAGQLLAMFQGFRVQIGEELDLRNEARAMAHYRWLLDQVDLHRITVPEVFEDLSGPRVLTMEFFDGVPVDDLTTVAHYGYDPAPVVQEVIKGFLLTAIRWGTFHGDVHAGNLLLLPDGRVGVIDWGIVGRLDPQTHLFFRRLIEAALGDESAWPDIASHAQRMYGPVLEQNLGMDHAEVEAFMRMAIEPVLTQPFGQVSLADLLNAPQLKVAEARGIEAERLTVSAVYRRFREQRQIRAAAEAHGVYDSDFDRSIFLLSKQLMYFERYGRIFLKDVGLFEDEEFFRSALAAPTTAGRF